jgi:HK97 family phage prohead protease
VWGRVDSYGDTVIKGAFAEALKTRRPMMLFGHNPGRVPGKWLSYEEDDKGLFVKGALTPGNAEARDIGANLKFGALNGLSIGGYSTDWESQKEGGRIIRGFDLYEISIVSMPAEQEARVDTASVKQMLDECDKLSDFEAFLREAGGLSKSAAGAMVARFSRIARGEPAGEGQSKAISDLIEVLRTPLPKLETTT